MLILIFADKGIDDYEVYILNNLSVDFVWIRSCLKSIPILVCNLFEGCLVYLFGELISV